MSSRAPGEKGNKKGTEHISRERAPARAGAEAISPGSRAGGTGDQPVLEGWGIRRTYRLGALAQWSHIMRLMHAGLLERRTRATRERHERGVSRSVGWA